MRQNEEGGKNMKILKYLLTISLFLLIGGCAKPPAIVADPEDHVSGTKRLMIVAAVIGADVIESTDAYNAMTYRSFNFVSPYWNGEKERTYLQTKIEESGLSSLKTADGVIVVGKVYCCGGPYEFINRVFAFAPNSMDIHVRDNVEVTIGNESKKSLNRVTKIVEKHSDPATYHCYWLPAYKNLWNRIIYCDEMKAEGWEEHKNWLSEYDHTWIKSPEIK